jgi:hypothetical protein
MEIRFHCFCLLNLLPIPRPICDPGHIKIVQLDTCVSIFGIASVRITSVTLGAECKAYTMYFIRRRLSFPHDTIYKLFAFLHYFYTLIMIIR